MIDISPEQVRTVQSILKNYLGTQKVFAFGSRVNAKARPTADLDLMIIGHNKLDLSLLGEILNAFSSSNLPFRVDVLDAARVDAQVKESMLRNSEEFVF